MAKSDSTFTKRVSTTDNFEKIPTELSKKLIDKYFDRASKGEIKIRLINLIPNYEMDMEDRGQYDLIVTYDKLSKLEEL